MEAASPTGKWRITANWTDELAEKVVQFLTSNHFEFYGDGRALEEKTARNVVAGARERAAAGVPFTRFPVLDASGQVIGEFAIGFDDNPKKLQIAGRGLEKHQHQEIGREILQWCFTKYIPELDRKGIRFPVLADGQDQVAWKDKKVQEWLDLRDVSVVATVHPDYSHCRHLLEKTGFKQVDEITKPNFKGVHDGRRAVYEIALKSFLHNTFSARVCGFFDKIPGIFKHSYTAPGLKW